MLRIAYLMNLDDTNSPEPITEEQPEDEGWGFLPVPEREVTINTNGSANARLELDQYLREPLVNRKMSPFGWWCTNEEKFPTLARLARRYLFSPRSSGVSERELKQAKQINSGREQLKPKKLEMLLFNKFNLGWLIMTI